MANWLSHLGFTQICVARGNVSWGSKDNDAAGELQLWFREWVNEYCLYASNTARDNMTVCKVIDVSVSVKRRLRTRGKMQTECKMQTAD